MPNEQLLLFPAKEEVKSDDSLSPAPCLRILEGGGRPPRPQPPAGRIRSSKACAVMHCIAAAA